LLSYMGAVSSCGVEDCSRCGSISIAADSKLARLTTNVSEYGAGDAMADSLDKVVAHGFLGNGIRDFSETGKEYLGKEGDQSVPAMDDPRSVQDRLFQSAREGNFKRSVEALGQGADVHAKTLRGQTALMLAACSNSRGTLDVLRFLMDTLSDLEAKDDSGWTPLLHACRNNQQEASALLLERNASIKARTADGATCVMLAAMDGGDNLVMDLIGKQAPMDKKDDRGWSVLFVACEDGRLELVRWLLRKQANVKEKAKDGCTAVMVAASSGNKKIGERLFKKGASVNAANSDGDTALILSIKARKEDYATWLIEAGAEVAVRNNNDEDAIELAESTGLFQLRGKLELKLRLVEDFY